MRTPRSLECPRSIRCYLSEKEKGFVAGPHSSKVRYREESGEKKKTSNLVGYLAWDAAFSAFPLEAAYPSRVDKFDEHVPENGTSRDDDDDDTRREMQNTSLRTKQGFSSPQILLDYEKFFRVLRGFAVPREFRYSSFNARLDAKHFKRLQLIRSE